MTDTVYALSSTESGLTIGPGASRSTCFRCGRAVDQPPDPDVNVSMRIVRLDFIHEPPIYMASRRFLRFLRRRELTGLSAREVPSLPSYLRQVWPAVLLGAQGSRSQCEACGTPEPPPVGMWDAAATDWSGQSFFALAWRPSVLLCSAAAADVLADAQMRGLVLVPAEALPSE